MPTVNERCKILRSLNRVYVFEIVLLLVPRVKILRRRGLSYFGIFEKQRGKVQFPRNKPQHKLLLGLTETGHLLLKTRYRELVPSIGTGFKDLKTGQFLDRDIISKPTVASKLKKGLVGTVYILDLAP